MSDWNRIVESNARNVFNAAYRVLGNFADAEDVSQEVFAEAIGKWTAESNQQWAGLLKRLAVCRAIDQLRRRKSSTVLPEVIADPNSYEPFESVSAAELHEQLRDTISKLPPRQAQVFCLCYFEKQSHETVAELLEINASAVASALFNARSKLALVFREPSTGEVK